MGSSTNKKIARNTVFLYLRMILVLLVSLYITREILNVLGVVDYGIYNIVGGFVSLFTFLSGTMDGAIQRFYNYEKGKDGGRDLKIVYTTSLAIQVVLLVVLIVILETFGIWYLYNKMVLPNDRLWAAMWCFQFSVFSLALLLVQIPYSAAVMAFEDMDYYAMVSVIDIILKLGAVLVLPFITADSLIVYALLLFVASIFKFLMYYIYAKKKYACIKIQRRIDFALFKEMLSFSGWSFFESFAFTLSHQGINIVLNAFFGPVVNAARGVAAQVQAGLQGLSSNVVAAFRPQLTESCAQGNNGRVLNYMYTLSKISYILLLTFCVPIIVELDYILDLWLNGVVPDYTASFTILVLVNMTIGSLNTPITNVVYAVGKVRDYQLFHSILVILTVPVSLVLFYISDNPNLALWVVLISTILNQPVSMYLLNKVFNFSYRDYTKQVVWPCLIITIFLPILPYIVHCLIGISGFLKLCVVVIVSVISMVVISYVCVLNKQEKILAKDMMCSLSKKITKRRVS